MPRLLPIIATAKFDYSWEMQILTNSNESVRAVSSSSSSWQNEMKNAIRTGAELLKFLHLKDSELSSFPEAINDFPVFAPPSFLNRIEKGNPGDPLLRQILPLQAEDFDVEGFVLDPLQESVSTRSPGILQKYEGRVLLVLTGACAIHCRYCFRRHFPYGESPRGSEWESAIQEIENDASINEVLLSGGDPLTLVDDSLKLVLQKIDTIPHVKRIRIHTRLPIVIPSRVNSLLLEIIASLSKKLIVVIHCNHANEIDRDVERACLDLQRTGAMLFNQSVLLQGVNDSVEALSQLSEQLVSINVTPYYLHQLDPVAGVAHFQVDVERGKELIRRMRARMPGYAVPRYVQEIAGEPNKTVLA